MLRDYTCRHFDELSKKSAEEIKELLVEVHGETFYEIIGGTIVSDFKRILISKLKNMHRDTSTINPPSFYLAEDKFTILVSESQLKEINADVGIKSDKRIYFAETDARYLDRTGWDVKPVNPNKVLPLSAWMKPKYNRGELLISVTNNTHPNGVPVLLNLDTSMIFTPTHKQFVMVNEIMGDTLIITVNDTKYLCNVVTDRAFDILNSKGVFPDMENELYSELFTNKNNASIEEEEIAKKIVALTAPNTGYIDVKPGNRYRVTFVNDTLHLVIGESISVPFKNIKFSLSDDGTLFVGKKTEAIDSLGTLHNLGVNKLSFIGDLSEDLEKEKEYILKLLRNSPVMEDFLDLSKFYGDTVKPVDEIKVVIMECGYPLGVCSSINKHYLLDKNNKFRLELTFKNNICHYGNIKLGTHAFTLDTMEAYENFLRSIAITSKIPVNHVSSTNNELRNILRELVPYKNQITVHNSGNLNVLDVVIAFDEENKELYPLLLKENGYYSMFMVADNIATAHDQSDAAINGNVLTIENDLINVKTPVRLLGWSNFEEIEMRIEDYSNSIGYETLRHLYTYHSRQRGVVRNYRV